MPGVLSSITVCKPSYILQREVIFIEEERLEEDSEERAGPTQMEVKNSILRAFIDISYHEQQSFDDEE
jgi:hypothetical protein